MIYKYKCPVCGDVSDQDNACCESWRKAVCSSCHGSGVQTLRVIEMRGGGLPTSESANEIDCIRCEGGAVKPKTFMEDTITWCKCGDDFEFGGYPQGPHGSCDIPKEHVHCLNCGGVSQLG